MKERVLSLFLACVLLVSLVIPSAGAGMQLAPDQGVPEVTESDVPPTQGDGQEAILPEPADEGQTAEGEPAIDEPGTEEEPTVSEEPSDGVAEEPSADVEEEPTEEPAVEVEKPDRSYITVKYFDDTNGRLFTTESFGVLNGESKTIYAPEIAGYKIAGDDSYTFSNVTEDMEYVFHYVDGTVRKSGGMSAMADTNPYYEQYAKQQARKIGMVQIVFLNKDDIRDEIGSDWNSYLGGTVVQCVAKNIPHWRLADVATKSVTVQAGSVLRVEFMYEDLDSDFSHLYRGTVEVVHKEYEFKIPLLAENHSWSFGTYGPYNAVTIPGYEAGIYDTTSAPIQGNFQSNTFRQVVYLYKMRFQLIEVKYWDDTNNVLIDSEYITVPYADSYTINARPFAGYTAKAPTSYTFNDITANQTYTFHYTKDNDGPGTKMGTVHIYGVNKDNPNEVLYNEFVSIEGGTTYSASRRTIGGWLPDAGDPGTKSILVVAENIVHIVFYYIKDGGVPVIPKGRVIVQHLDADNGYAILAQDEYEVVLTSFTTPGSYAVAPKSIPWYTYTGLAPGSDPISGAISAGQTRTVKFAYSQIKADIINGKKVWVDANNAKGARPGSITINLLRNGTVVAGQSKTINGTGNEWTFSYANLPKFDSRGNEYTYTVDEASVPADYVKTITGYTITNTYGGKFTVTAKKTWNDANNAKNTRPASVTINLFRNGVLLTSKPATAPTWQVAFDDLDEFNQGTGSKYVYTVDEATVPTGYTKVSVGNEANSYTINNKLSIFDNTIGVSGKKAWDDANDKLGIRPLSASMTINLLRDGTVVDSKAPDTSWNVFFSNLPEYNPATANKYVYTIDEAAVPTGYTKVSAGNEANNYTITNIPTAFNQTFNLNGKKTWDDANNVKGSRPATLTINLYRDGLLQTTTTTNASWNFAFNDLLVYNKLTGNKYVYTVDEATVPTGYTKVSTGNESNSYTISNILTIFESKIDISGRKVWDDANNASNTRPNSLTIKLFRDGTDSGLTQATDGAWGFTFSQVYEYNRTTGDKYVYTVDEATVPTDYTKVSVGNAANNYNITNRLSAFGDRVTINGRVAWDDANNAKNTRPASVQVVVYQDGVAMPGGPITTNGAGNWEFTFPNLPRINTVTGLPYVYTVDETAVPSGYEKVSAGNAGNNYTISNKLAIFSEKVTVTATKSWDDGGNAFNQRATSVVLSLHSDVVGSVDQNMTASAANNWKVSFVNLPKYNTTDANLITYTILEKTVPTNYTLISITKNGSDYDWVVLNRHEKMDEKITITGKKAWKDSEYKTGRPTNITVQLLANGTMVTSKVVSGTGDVWDFDFANQPRFSSTDGSPINYTVDEATVPTGYDKTIVGNVITNTLKTQYITVTYFDTTNNVVIDTEIVPVAYGSSPTLHARPFAGFTPVAPTTRTFANVTADTTYTFNYTKDSDGPGTLMGTIHIVHVNKANAKDVLYNEFVSLEAGKSQSFSSRTIAGWTFDTTDTSPKSATAIAGQVVVVTFRYTKDSGPVIDKDKALIVVKHVDANSGRLLTSDEYDVTAGAYGPYSQTSIPGYVYVGLDAASAPVSGTIAAGETKTIIFNYSIGMRYLTITYWNDTDNVAIEVESVPVAYGSTPTVHARPFAGFTPKSPTTYTFPTVTADATYTFHYTKDTIIPGTEMGTIHVIHVNKDNAKDILYNEYVNAEAGSILTFASRAIAGWTFDTTDTSPKTAVVVAQTTKQVIFRYTKGTGPVIDKDKALIVIRCEDATSGRLLSSDEYEITAGTYGPYNPTVIPYYTYKALKAGSDPVSGTVAAGGTKTITFLYDTKTLPTKEGQLTWVDDNNAYNTRPPSVVIAIYRDGVYQSSVTTTAALDWKYSFPNLPQFADDGHEYVYTVDEPTVPTGYNKTVSGMNITNTLKFQHINVVFWDDTNNVQIDTESVTAYYGSNKTVHARPFAGYTAKAPITYTFSNVTADATYTFHYTKDTDGPGTKMGTIHVKHVDKANAANVLYNEYASIEAGTSQTFASRTIAGWKFDTTDTSPKTATAIADTVVVVTFRYEKDDGPIIPEKGLIVIRHEDAVSGRLLFTNEDDVAPGNYGPYAPTSIPGYVYKELKAGSAAVSGTIAANETKTITFLYDKKTLPTQTGTLTWVDDNNAYNTRPAQVTINLYQNGTLYTSAVTNAAGGWTYSFPDLPELDDNGVPYVYTVDEPNVPVGYDKTINGMNITNTLKYQHINVTFWDDTNNKKIDSESITVFFGSTKTVYARPFAGYTAKAPTSYTFSNINGDVNYTFHYLKDTDGPGTKMGTIHVVHVDKDNAANVLYNEYVSIEAGTSQTFTSRTIAGWKFDTTDTSPKTATAIADTVVSLTFRYERDGGPVIPEKALIVVKNIDADNGRVLSSDEYEIAAGAYGPYEPITIPWYIYKDMAAGSAAKSGTIAAGETKTIIFRYEKEKLPTQTGKITWVDNDNANNTRPAQVTVQLFRNGELINSAVVTAAGNWEYSFPNLPKFDDNGTPYVYTVDEPNVPVGYDKTVNGMNITNTLKYQHITVTYWDDTNNVAIDTESVPVLFGSNPTVHARPFAGYTALTPTSRTFFNISGDATWTFHYIKNTDGPGTKMGTIHVVHVDKANAANVLFNEYVSIEAGTSQSFTSRTITGWKFDTTDTSPKTATAIADSVVIVTFRYEQDGGPIVIPDKALIIVKNIDAESGRLLSSDEYDVKAGAYGPYEPITIPWYTYKDMGTGSAAKSGTIAAGETKTIIFRYERTKIAEISGKKIWVDDNNSGTTRPASVTLNLFMDGVYVQDATANAAGNWEVKFTNLPKYDSKGREYVYTIDEANVPAGYTKTVSGMQVTNTLTDLVNVAGTKVWVDNNNAESTRPASLVITLLRNGTAYKTATVNTANWTYAFNGLPKYAPNGDEYVYTVDELTVPAGYTKLILGYNITNSLSQKTSVSGQKIWVDGNNFNSSRPASVVIQLKRNGTVVQTKSISAMGAGTFTFSNLAKMDATGTDFVYTVDEAAVPAGYTKTVSGNNITNTLTDVINIAGVKTWVDNNNAQGTRPASVTIELTRNNIHFTQVDVDTSGNNQYSFTGLSRLDGNGVAYNYAVREIGVPAGYTATVSGYNITNTLTDVVSVAGEKIWQDGGVTTSRPATITVNLYRNNVLADSKDISQAVNWQYTFSNLAKYDTAGNEYVYSVDEARVPPTYTKTISGYNIINRKVRVHVRTNFVCEGDPDFGSPYEDRTLFYGDSVTLFSRVFPGYTLISAPTKVFVNVTKDEEHTFYYVRDFAPAPGPGGGGVSDGSLAAGGASFAPLALGALGGISPSADSPQQAYAKKIAAQMCVIQVKCYNKDDDREMLCVDYYTVRNGETFTATARNNIKGWNVDGAATQTVTAVGGTTKTVIFKYTPTDVDKPDLEWMTYTTLEVLHFDRLVRSKPDDAIYAEYHDMLPDITYGPMLPVSFPGYQPGVHDATSAPVAGTISTTRGQVTTVVFLYDMRFVYLTVEFREEGTNTLLGSEVVVVPYSLGTTVHARPIVGYKPVDTAPRAFSNMTVDAKTVFYYTKDPVLPVMGTIQVIHRDKSNPNNQLLLEYITAEVGKDVQVTKRDIPGWTFDTADTSPKTVQAKQYELVTVTFDYVGAPPVIDKGLVIVKHLDKVTSAVLAEEEIEFIGSYSVGSKNIPAYTFDGLAPGSDPASGAIAAGATKTVTFLYVRDSITIEGEKVWVDQNDALGLRPDKLNIELYRNGSKVDTVEITKAAQWKYKFENLPEKDNAGNSYVYTLKEETVPTGYTAAVSADLKTITNTHAQGVISIEGQKVWDDGADSLGYRPTSLAINLFRNGTQYKTTVTNAAQGWAYKFENLPEKDGTGATYNYTVDEVIVPKGYEKTLFASDPTKINNGLKFRYITVTYWDDTNNKLIDTEIVPVVDGYDVTIHARPFAGYTPKSPTTHTITGVTADGAYTFKYTQDSTTPGKDMGTVHVLFVEKGNEKNVLYNEYVSANAGVTLTFKERTIAGWLYDSADPANKQATVEAGKVKTVKFLYTKDGGIPVDGKKALIVVRHEDADTGALLSMDEFDITAGSYGPYSQTVIPGYSFKQWKSTSATVSGTINAGQTKVIVFEYQANVGTQVELTIRYCISGTTTEIRTADKPKVTKGVNYTVYAPTITNYTLVSPSPYTFVNPQGGEIHTFYYTGNVGPINNPQNVIVSYVDATTNVKLLPDETFSVPYGGTITVTAKPISGYVAQSPTSYTLVNVISTRTVTFYYLKEEVDPATETPIPTPGDEETLTPTPPPITRPSTDVVLPTPPPTNSGPDGMPRTGGTDLGSLGLMAGVLLFGTGLLFAKRRKKADQDK